MTEEKEKFPTVTTEWSENIETILKEIGDSCKGYKFMNSTAAKNHSFYYNILMYTLIILSPVAGCILIIDSEQENAATVLTFISGIITAVVKYSRFEEKVVTYKGYAAKYASLEGNIRRQLSLRREDRPNPGEYLQWANSCYDSLFSSAPLIPNKIYKEWTKFAKENNLTIPKELSLKMSDEYAKSTKESLKQLRTLKDIKIDAKNSPENERKRATSQSELENNADIRGVPISELNTYSDEKMKYEMRRLFGQR